MTQREFARMGGLARAKKLSPSRRRQIAQAAGIAPKKKRKAQAGRKA